jgi:hypothetical protein
MDVLILSWYGSCAAKQSGPRSRRVREKFDTSRSINTAAGLSMVPAAARPRTALFFLRTARLLPCRRHHGDCCGCVNDDEAASERASGSLDLQPKGFRDYQRSYDTLLDRTSNRSVAGRSGSRCARSEQSADCRRE